MATVGLSVIGAVVGGSVGGPAGARWGQAIGALAGGLIEGSRAPSNRIGKLDDLRISGSSYGAAIPWVWGVWKQEGIIIWSGGLTEQRKKRGVRLLGTRRTTYSYKVDVAVMLCRGPVTAVKTIWANDTVIYDTASGLTPANITVKLGDYTQSVITAMDDAQVGPVPAYRGRCYFYIDNLDLTPYGNQMPSFSALVENGASYEDTILADGPLAYWRFEDAPGLLADTGIGGYDLATTSGTPSQTTGRHGEGIAVVSTTTPADNTRVIGQVSAFHAATLSVEWWFQYKGGSPNASGASRVKYRNGTPANNDLWHFSVEPNLFTSEMVLTWIVDQTGLGDYVTIHQHSVARDTNWHQAVVVWDENALTSKLYVDGALADTDVAFATASSPQTNAEIFLRVTNNNRLDEVVIYDRALTAAEIAEHFAPSGTAKLKNILADIAQECGIAGEHYDFRTATDTVTGFAVTERTEARGAIEDLLRLHFTDLAEVDGKLVSVKRGGAVVATIEAEDLGARMSEGGELPEVTEVVTVERLQELELPFRVDVGYYSPLSGYQQSIQSAIRYTKQHLQEQFTVQSRLVLTDSAARNTAEKLLYAAWVERMTFETSLPPKYLYLAPADPVNLIVEGETFRCRLLSVDMPLPGPLQCRLVLDEPAVLTQDTPAGAPPVEIALERFTTPTSLVAWNGNALDEDDIASVGLYYSMNATAGTGRWSGGELHLSRDGGTTYELIDESGDPGTFGTTTSVLAAFTETQLWDTTSTVNITLTQGTDEPPVTMSDAEVLAGFNRALVGDEWVGFAVVTSLGGNSYQLSRLLRGLQGTDTFADEHRTGERVVFDDGGIRRVELPGVGSGYVNLKALGAGQALGDVSAVSVYVYGRELLAWTPAHFTATRDGGLNVSLSWQRRSRLAGTGIVGAVPFDFTSERYSVFVMPAAGTTITAITQAAQAVVTAAGHGLVAGDRAFLTGIAGMVEANGLTVNVVSVAGNNATLDLDTRPFTSYVSGGTIREPLREITATTNSASYTSAQQTSDFGSAQPSILFALYQKGDDNRLGYPTIKTL